MDTHTHTHSAHTTHTISWTHTLATSHQPPQIALYTSLHNTHPNTPFHSTSPGLSLGTHTRIHTHAKNTPTNAAEKEQTWNSEVGRGQKAWKSLLVKKYGGKTN